MAGHLRSIGVPTNFVTLMSIGSFALLTAAFSQQEWLDLVGALRLKGVTHAAVGILTH